jgi:hypothetical protein
MEEEVFVSDQDYSNELLNIIECCLSVLVTLSEMEEKSYDEETEDIIKVKVRTYKIILQAEDKLFKQIKSI